MTKITWRRLNPDEVLQEGDFWVSRNSVTDAPYDFDSVDARLAPVVDSTHGVIILGKTSAGIYHGLSPSWYPFRPVALHIDDCENTKQHSPDDRNIQLEL